MLGSLFRALIVIVLVVAAAAFFFGYRYANGRVVGPAEPAPVGTVGRSDEPIDTDAARERGAEAAGKTAEAGNRVADALSDGAVTTKIKSKMALDETVKALNIDVTTRDGTVTLSGDVHSEKERERALALARETSGVTRVVDRLTVRR